VKKLGWSCMLTEIQNCTDILENSLAVSYKLNMQWPYDIAIAFLGFCPREIKICAYIETCPWMFTEALFRAAPNWKQSNYPLIDEWLNKLWWIHTIEYFSATKENKLLIHPKSWWISKELYWVKMIIPKIYILCNLISIHS
jgi:hypothetical protein